MRKAYLLVSFVILSFAFTKTARGQTIIDNFPNPEDAVGETCNDVCQREGLTCSDVGSDDSATDGRMYTRGVFGECAITAQDSVSCSDTMGDDDPRRDKFNAVCGSGYETNWTRCRCIDPRCGMQTGQFCCVYPLGFYCQQPYLQCDSTLRCCAKDGTVVADEQDCCSKNWNSEKKCTAASTITLTPSPAASPGSAGIDFANLMAVATPKFGTGSTLGSLMNEVIKYLFPLIGFALLAYLVYGGYEIMMSQNIPEKIAKGRSVIMYAIIGFIILFLAYWIVKIVGEVLGIQAIKDIFR